MSKMGTTSKASFLSIEGTSIDTLPVYVKELISGGAAGAISKTAVAPIERIKILFQIRTPGFQSLGVYQSLKRLLKHEGVPGFYKGNGASIIRIVPYSALYFMTFERFRCWMLDHHSSVLGSGSLVDLLAGSAAGGAAILSTYPLDLARTLLAYEVVNTKASLKNGSSSIIAQPRYTSTINVLATVYREAGVRGLYRGLGPTLISILPYVGLRFCVYEELKRHVSEEQQKSILMSLACGGMAALLGQTITYPLDVVKRQMQVENLQDGNARHKNTWKGIATIVSQQGWRQLFAGLSVNYLKIVPSTAIGFTAYDLMKVWLHIPPRQKTPSVSTA